MTAPEAEFDDANEYPALAEMSERRKNDLRYQAAWALFVSSIPHSGGEPTLSPERAFTLASEFVAEAERRGL